MKQYTGLLVCNNLINVLNLDYDLYLKINKKFKNFLIIDLSRIYGFQPEKKPKLFKIFRPKNFQELENFLKKSNNVFFNHIPRNFFFINFHIFISKFKIVNIELIRGNSIQLDELNYKKKNYTFVFKKKFLRAIYKFLTLCSVIKAYDYLFISTKNIKKYYHNSRDKFLNRLFFTKKFFKHKKIITINDKAADLSKMGRGSEKFIVYIDSPVMPIKNSDIPASAFPDKSDMENFYKLVEKALLKISKKYKKKVLINLHPKTNFSIIRKYFKKFNIKKFDLWNSIDHAYLVTGIGSTAYSYAIIKKKRRLIFFTKKMGQFNCHRAKILSESYKILLLNLDKSNSFYEKDLINKKTLNILKKKVKLNDYTSGTDKICKILKNFKTGKFNNKITKN